MDPEVYTLPCACAALIFISIADFDGLPVAMTFESCSIVCVNVTIMNDLVLEKTENISVILQTNDGRVTLEQKRTNMSIIDNEGTYCWCDKINVPVLIDIHAFLRTSCGWI